MNEFDIIAGYFAQLTPDGVDDDAAILNIPEGRELVVTSDTLNAGTHFLLDAKPAQIAHKALRVNLSDLAAMGAEPLCYQLNIAFPEEPQKEWLAEFTGALAADQKQFNIFCSGGDTTGIYGPLSISITAMGTVPEGQAITRAGAKNGDLILLTGPVGDAFLALSDEDPYFSDKYYKPVPRLDLAQVVRMYANAAIDISDGLVADLGHICDASSLSAQVRLADIPFSDLAKELLDRDEVEAADLITGGDDYELILAVPQKNKKHFKDAYVIGRFEGGEGVQIINEKGKTLSLEHTGWSHF